MWFSGFLYLLLLEMDFSQFYFPCVLSLWFYVSVQLWIGNLGLFFLPLFWSMGPEVKQQWIQPLRTVNQPLALKYNGCP